MDNLINYREVKKGVLINSIIAFVLYISFIITSIALFDFVFFYKEDTCNSIMLLYFGLFLIAIILYFILFRFKPLELFKTRNLEAINRITKETSNFINKHRLLEMFTKNLISMVENNSGVAMWIKDEEDRYIFANKALRLILFKGKEMYELVGKTDGEIRGKPSNNKKIEAYLRLINPDEYPNLNSKQFIDNNSICNLTDIITRVLRVPCRFYEEVEELSLDVYKTPLIDDSGNIIGTVGTLFDITNNKDLKKAGLILMESENKAFKINGSNNYYIKEYTFGEFI